MKRVEIDFYVAQDQTHRVRIRIPNKSGNMNQVFMSTDHYKTQDEAMEVVKYLLETPWVIEDDAVKVHQEDNQEEIDSGSTDSWWSTFALVVITLFTLAAFIVFLIKHVFA